jgi:hypothetical protein
MLLKKEDSEALVIGNIQENKVGISTENLGLIVTLLSSNLYSKPLQSFIRETVSNAWDAHIEANNTEEPILMLVNQKDKNVEIAIRDYGTGLSEERFQDIYLNLCSSTKRNSNDYIGCMGLGRLSALAVSDVVTINNYYNGTLSSYLMYKDEGTIKINKVFSSATEEHNGLEVKLEVPYFWRKITDFLEGLYQVQLFEKLYVSTNVSDIEDRVNAFNNRVIFENDCIKTSDLSVKFGWKNHFGIVMGNVIYEYYIDTPYLDSVYLKANIGDLDVTPSREALLLNEKTTTKIKELRSKCDAYITTLIKQLVEKDYSSLLDFIHHYNCNYISIVLYNGSKMHRLDCKKSISQLEQIIDQDKITINGKKIPKDVNIYDYCKKVNTEVIKIPILYSHKSIKSYNDENYPRISLVHIQQCLLEIQKFTIIKKSDFKKSVLSYLRENSYKSIFVRENLNISLIRIIRTLLKIYDKKLASFVYEDLKNNYISNIDDYVWVNDMPKKSRSITVDKGNFKYIVRQVVMGRGDVPVIKPINSSELKNTKKVKIVYDTSNSEYIKDTFLMYHYARLLSRKTDIEYRFIVCSPKDVTTIKSYNSIDVHTFINTKNNMLGKMLTIINAIYTYDNYTVRSALLKHPDLRNYTDAVIYYLAKIHRYIIKKYLNLYNEKKWLKYNILNIIDTYSKEYSEKAKEMHNKQLFYSYVKQECDCYFEKFLEAIYHLKFDPKPSLIKYKESKNVINKLLKYEPNKD